MADPIGLCTWIFGHQRHREIAALAAELGCEGVELHVPLDAWSAADIRHLYASFGLRILSLTPENVDLAHPDIHEQQRAERYYSRLIAFAAALEAPAVTIHEQVGRGAAPDTPQREGERLRGACQRLARLAEEWQVDLLLEPLRPPLVSQLHRAIDAVRLCEAVGSPRLRIVLDTFHMDATERDPGRAIALCAGRLGAVQLADRQRRGLGLGGLDLQPYWQGFEAIGFRGPWLLECAVGLSGPCLQTQAVDIHQLRLALESSLMALRRHLAARPPRSTAPGREVKSPSQPEA
ncbi:MAG: sugar phosphate isomerase/epimerase family protein [Cyanobacteriota bacterium]|jgi:D-psicose/D-tagatose/L-ribulose 3-epimerase